MSSAYDLLLKGGQVIDPKNGVNGRADVAIKDQKIAAVGPDLPGQAAKIIEVSELCVTPGLIDIHLHAYGGYEGWLFPDQHNLPYGVTTVVDTGGAGWKDFEDFRTTIIERSRTRVLAFLNIVRDGMTGAPEQDTTQMQPEPCAEMIRRYPQYLVGSKTAHFGGPGWEAAGGAIEAARLSGTIAMIDFAPRPTRTYKELLERLSPGDIHTHLYAAHIPLLDENKKINDYVWEARRRGVIFDTGHGAGSFWFRIAVPALAQGFQPDTISTDLHKNSRLGPNALMTITMSKFLALGMPLQEVIYRSTQKPAEVIRRPELGHLSVGAEADVAVLELQEGEFGFTDSGGARQDGTQKLECQLTVRKGEIVWDLNGRGRPRWQEAGEYRRAP
ncbi:MAG: amidohydrolase/deacetylase family metallohydrolase [Candidatus Latescibacteria bacterium]|nr:amidohydrolase/deacetylase family metallohydrolase [Candidatus Latescibacterota bacterium]